jgi:quinol monooxygenase YgiN
MAEVVVVATVVPKPGQQQNVLDAFRKHVADVHVEDGCELYSLHARSTGDVMVIEKWRDAEALAAHSAGPVLGAIGAELADLLAAPLDVIELDAVVMGDAAKGSV